MPRGSSYMNGTSSLFLNIHLIFVIV
jgi:hypothetical protein